METYSKHGILIIFLISYFYLFTVGIQQEPFSS